MAATPKDDKPQAARHVYGPRAIAAVLPPVLRPALRKRSPAAARILTDWEAMVGPGLAAITTPRNLAAGVLLLGCSGPIALELLHISDQLAARINAYLGSTAVTRIRLVQEFHPAPATPMSSPDLATTERAAAAAVASVPAGPLRDSLLRLGQRVLGSSQLSLPSATRRT